MVIAAALAIWLSVNAGCGNPSTSVEVLPNNYNPVFVCAKTPLPLCGISYRLLPLNGSNVTVTHRYNDYRGLVGFDYTQPFVIPSPMYSVGTDWGWTMVPAQSSYGPEGVVDMYTFSTPVNTFVYLAPESSIAFSPKLFDVSCANAVELPGDGRLPPPFNLKINKQ